MKGEYEIMITKVYAYDGKEFSGKSYELLANECNAYEADLRLKKQKEEAERKAREEKAKERQQKKDLEFQEIQKQLNVLNNLVNDYGKRYNESIYYTNERGNLKIHSDLWGFYNIYDLLKLI